MQNKKYEAMKMLMYNDTNFWCTINKNLHISDSCILFNNSINKTEY